LDNTLDSASPTLDGIPDFGDDLRDQLIPRSRDILRDVNPMVDYLRPYGPEIGGFLANFNAMVNYTDEAGNHYFRTFLTGNDASVATPLGLKAGALTYYNPIPKAGGGSQPGPFTGKFPRLERQPR
jgi:phospholipid/cholesterol/gamma-HCH transport system substrate-binding protein